MFDNAEVNLYKQKDFMSGYINQVFKTSMCIELPERILKTGLQALPSQFDSDLSHLPTILELNMSYFSSLPQYLE